MVEWKAALNTPGPAKYNTSRPISAGPMYRFSRKDNKHPPIPTTPGPDKYNAKSCFDEHLKAKSFGTKAAYHKKDQQD